MLGVRELWQRMQFCAQSSGPLDRDAASALTGACPFDIEHPVDKHAIVAKTKEVRPVVIQPNLFFIFCSILKSSNEFSFKGVAVCFAGVLSIDFIFSFYYHILVNPIIQGKGISQFVIPYRGFFLVEHIKAYTSL